MAISDSIGRLLKIKDIKVHQKLRRTIIYFLAIITIITLYTIVTLYQQKNDGLMINIAGRQRMLSQKYTKEVFLGLKKAQNTAGQSNPAVVLDEAKGSRKLFEVSLNALARGGTTFSDPKMVKEISLPGVSRPEIINKLDQVDRLWKQLVDAADDLVKNQQADTAVFDRFNAQSVKVLVEMNRAVGLIAEASDHKVRILQITQIIMWIIAVGFSIPMTKAVTLSIILPIFQILKRTKKIALGDLRAVPIKHQSNDELGILSKNIDDMRRGLRDIINTVQQNARQMTHSSAQIARVSKEISDTANQEKEGAVQIQSATADLETITSQVNDHVSSTLKTIEETRDQSLEGLKVVRENISDLVGTAENVNETAAHIEQLKDATGEIQNVIDVIQGFTDQTNLLALNATIEAARAGEAGKGFAVVAGEIKTLSGEIAQSTLKITDLLNNFSGQVSAAVNAMEGVVSKVNHTRKQSGHTVAAFENTGKQVEITIDSARNIMEFNRRQQDQLTLLRGHFISLFKVLKNNNAKAETTTLVAKELSIASDRLQAILERFSTDHEKAVPRNTDEKRNAPRISNSIIVKLKTKKGHIEGITHDISMGGLNLRCRQQLETNRPYQAELLIPQLGNRKKNIPLTIKVIREQKNDEDFFYGVEYLDTGPEQEIALKEIFDFYLKPNAFA